MPATVTSLTLPCWGEGGVWLGELQLADRKGERSIETDDTNARISIAELSDYVVLLRSATSDVTGFAAPISAGRVESNGALFGFLASQAGLGRIRVGLTGSSGEEIWQHPLWIRPGKFRDAVEFELMVSEICDWRTNLALDLRASTSAPWVLDANVVAWPPEERLAVLRAAVEQNALLDALSFVERNASARLERDSTVARLGAASIDAHRLSHHLASAGRRTAVPASHPLAGRLSSLPLEMPATRRYETVDTPENRFAKLTALGFRNRIIDSLRVGIDARTPLGSWATRTASRLDRLLSGTFYSGLGAPGHVDLGSPALQRRRGYRSILKAFLAARAGLAIRWNELDALVDAETRDVPSLYEIWCLVILRRAISTEFAIQLSNEHLRMGATGLTLGRGTAASADRLVEIDGRLFALRLWYNRSFAPTETTHAEGNWRVRASTPGTWTKTMKPDFTIELRETENAGNDLIRPILIHLDAKYRLKSIELGKDGMSEKSHVADDIDKMHAYLFGINESVGAYILYPGDFVSYFRRSGLRSTIGAVAAVPGRTGHLGEALREILVAAVRDA